MTENKIPKSTNNYQIGSCKNCGHEKREQHLWIYKELIGKGEIFYCQKCLCEILITRWKNITEQKIIQRPVFKGCGGWKE